MPCVVAMPFTSFAISTTTGIDCSLNEMAWVRRSTDEGPIACTICSAVYEPASARVLKSASTQSSTIVESAVRSSALANDVWLSPRRITYAASFALICASVGPCAAAAPCDWSMPWSSVTSVWMMGSRSDGDID